MNKPTRCVAIAVILFCVIETNAQRDVPIGTLPTYYNGGFAGEAGVTRVASMSYLKYRTSTEYLPPDVSRLDRTGTFISVDHFFRKIGSGVGLTAGMENFGSTSKGGLVSVTISPKFSGKGKFTFAPFADFSYQRFHNRLKREVSYPGGFSSNFITHDFNIRSGFLVNSTRAYIGLSADIARYATRNTLKEEWSAFSNMNYILQAGYTFQQMPESKFSFTPQLALSLRRFKYYDPAKLEVERLNSITLLDLNLMFRYDKVIAGINSTGFVLGYQTDRFKLQVTNFYSRKGRIGKTIEWGDHTTFDPNLFYIEMPDTYAGNLSLRYVFRKKESVKMPGF